MSGLVDRSAPYTVTFVCGHAQEIPHLPSWAVEFCRECSRWQRMTDRGVRPRALTQTALPSPASDSASPDHAVTTDEETT